MGGWTGGWAGGRAQTSKLSKGRLQPAGILATSGCHEEAAAVAAHDTAVRAHVQQEQQ